jgi:hypothetical protein
MNTKLKNSMIATGALAVLVAPTLTETTVMAANDANGLASSSSTTSSTSEVTDPGATMKTVATVNGIPLTKDKAIMPGDDVTWDVIATPGNTGTMTYFKDELPDGLKFSPNSKYAVTAYAVNNDGTLGDEVTNDGKLEISGQTVTWTPKDPEKYFYVGGDGISNRILFHITTKAENDVNPEVILENLATLRVTNPKTNKPTDVTDKARVHTVAELAPTLQKSVSADKGATWNDFVKLANKDATYEYALKATVPVGAMKSELVIHDPMEHVQTFNKDSIKVYAGDYTASTAAAASSAATSSTSSSASSATGSTNSAASSENATSETTASSVASSESSDSNANSTAAQNTRAVKDVTKFFKISVDDQGDVTATMDKDYVKAVRNSDQAQVYTLVVDGVTFKTASKDDLKKFDEGGLAYIPNIADMMVDKNNFKSNKTRVTAPEPLDPADGTIQKTVSVDGGKSWTENGTLNDQISTYDYNVDVVAPLAQNIKSMAITDEFLAGQTVDKSQLKIMMTNADGSDADVTGQGELKLEKNKDGNQVATWTPNEELIKQVNDAKDTGAKFKLVATNVTLKNSTADQLKSFIKDSTLTVPNTAELKVTDQNDKTTILKSNKVAVSIPQPNPKTTAEKAKELLAATSGAAQQHPIIAVVGGLLIALAAGFGAYKAGWLDRLKKNNN